MMTGWAVSSAVRSGAGGEEQRRTPRRTLIMQGLSPPPPSPQSHGDGTGPALSPGGGSWLYALSKPHKAKLLTSSRTRTLALALASPPLGAAAVDTHSLEKRGH